MHNNQLLRKLINFSEKEEELNKIQEDIDHGWTIVNLVHQGEEYFGIMEKIDLKENNTKIFIPPRKKIKIS